MGRGMPGTKRQFLAKTKGRFVKASQIAQRNAEIVIGFHEIGPDADGFAIGGDRFLVTVQLVQRYAQTVMRIRVARFYAYGVVETDSRLILSAKLAQRLAQIDM